MDKTKDKRKSRDKVTESAFGIEHISKKYTYPSRDERHQGRKAATGSMAAGAATAAGSVAGGAAAGKIAARGQEKRADSLGEASRQVANLAWQERAKAGDKQSVKAIRARKRANGLNELAYGLAGDSRQAGRIAGKRKAVGLGAGLLGAGAAVAAGNTVGAVKSRKAINQARAEKGKEPVNRLGYVKKSAFGVEHEFEKGAWGNAAVMATGRAMEGGQKAVKVVKPKLVSAGKNARGFAQGLAGKAPTPGANPAGAVKSYGQGTAVRDAVQANPMKAAGGAAGAGALTGAGIMRPKKQKQQ